MSAMDCSFDCRLAVVVQCVVRVGFCGCFSFMFECKWESKFACVLHCIFLLFDVVFCECFVFIDSHVSRRVLRLFCYCFWRLVCVAFHVCFAFSFVGELHFNFIVDSVWVVCSLWSSCFTFFHLVLISAFVFASLALPAFVFSSRTPPSRSPHLYSPSSHSPHLHLPHSHLRNHNRPLS